MFDQPKCAESTPISGVLRRMPTSSLTNRLNWSAYRSLAVTPFGSVGTGGAVMGSPDAAQPSIQKFFRPVAKKPRTA